MQVWVTSSRLMTPTISRQPHWRDRTHNMFSGWMLPPLGPGSGGPRLMPPQEFPVQPLSLFNFVFLLFSHSSLWRTDTQKNKQLIPRIRHIKRFNTVQIKSCANGWKISCNVWFMCCLWWECMPWNCCRPPYAQCVCTYQAQLAPPAARLRLFDSCSVHCHPLTPVCSGLATENHRDLDGGQRERGDKQIDMLFSTAPKVEDKPHMYLICSPKLCFK